MPTNVVPQWIDLIAQASPGYLQAPDNSTRFVACVFGYVYGTGAAGRTPLLGSRLGAAAVSLIAEKRTRITMADLVGPAALQAFAPFDALGGRAARRGPAVDSGAAYTFSVVAGCS